MPGKRFRVVRTSSCAWPRHRCDHERSAQRSPGVHCVECVALATALFQSAPALPEWPRERCRLRRAHFCTRTAPKHSRMCAAPPTARQSLARASLTAVTLRARVPRRMRTSRWSHLRSPPAKSAGSRERRRHALTKERGAARTPAQGTRAAALPRPRGRQRSRQRGRQRSRQRSHQRDRQRARPPPSAPLPVPAPPPPAPPQRRSASWQPELEPERSWEWSWEWAAATRSRSLRTFAAIVGVLIGRGVSGAVRTPAHATASRLPPPASCLL